ncbi:hypothetical protein Godav_023098 [Gossypium davidsonii]|uniref:Uncharacterized protein n=1 Tax=Gossypium davidsonii TaxID=34287 RepID=A0A7J8SQE8_GOSDV|nr:hypothetical protein [Gossypium davidsonii]
MDPLRNFPFEAQTRGSFPSGRVTARVLLGQNGAVLNGFIPSVLAPPLAPRRRSDREGYGDGPASFDERGVVVSESYDIWTPAGGVGADGACGAEPEDRILQSHIYNLPSPPSPLIETYLREAGFLHVALVDRGPETHKRVDGELGLLVDELVAIGSVQSIDSGTICYNLLGLVPETIYGGRIEMPRLGIRAVILEEFYVNPNVWHAKVPLVVYATVNMHEADRVLRQFGFQQLIFVTPQELDNLHRIDLQRLNTN